MSATGIVLALILAGVVLLIVALPLFMRAAPTTDALADKQRERLAAYYDRVVRNIRDLDEDHALGKLTETDYQAERALWAARGVQVLKALDTLNAADYTEAAPAISPTPATDAAVDAAIDEAIELAVQRAREREAVGG